MRLQSLETGVGFDTAQIIGVVVRPDHSKRSDASYNALRNEYLKEAPVWIVKVWHTDEEEWQAQAVTDARTYAESLRLAENLIEHCPLMHKMEKTK